MVSRPGRTRGRCVDAAKKERIEAAAAQLDQSVSTFVVHAAAAEADRVLARTETTVMPAEQFDALLAALDMADEASALARLTQRERRYPHP